MTTYEEGRSPAGTALDRKTTHPYGTPAETTNDGDQHLAVPDVTGLGLMDAALAYTDAGWFVGPVTASKRPGSLLGEGWQHKTSRDPDVIRRWFASPRAKAIALHVGRSGAVAFDVDTPDRLTGVLARELNGKYTGPFQSTRTTVPERGHYLYALPDGFISGNSNGDLGDGWGEVRGLNGVIIVEPSVHEKPEGRYRWITTGPLPVLPDCLRALMRPPGPGKGAVTTDGVADFLADYDQGAETDTRDAVVGRYRAAVDAGGSRHNAAYKAACQIARDALRGRYPAAGAFEELAGQFDVDTADRHRPGEWEEIMNDAIGSVLAADTEDADDADQKAAQDAFLSMVGGKAAPKVPPRTVDGWSFLAPGEPDSPPLWGDPHRAALWTPGESLFIFGPPGAGKSTLVQLVVWARLGLLADVLGFPVADDGRKVLYLAMDRPDQIKRSMRRLVRPEHETVLRDRLIVHRGPLDFSMTDPKERDRLRDWALDLGAGTVVVDSIKDVMPEVKPETAGEYNRARQSVLAAGIDLAELHHNRKAQNGNKEPRTLEDVYGGRWLTAGAGSVISLWQDEPGSPVISLRHIRTSGEYLRDTTLILDPATGELETEQAATLEDFIAAHLDGFTVAEAAAALHPGKVTKGQREAVRGRLKRMVARGALEITGDPFVDASAIRYRAVS